MRLGFGLEDLLQNALLELHKAPQTFNPKRGIQFDTYAGDLIKNRLIRLLAKAKTKKRGVTPLSLDEAVAGPISGTQIPRRERIEHGRSFVIPFADAEVRGQLISVIQSLKASARDKGILLDRFGLIDGRPKTYKKIGAKRKITDERAKQIVAGLLMRLRQNPKMKAFRDLLMEK